MSTLARSLLLTTLVLAACKKDAPAEAPVAAHKAAEAKWVTLTFLVTGAENGYLLPTAGEEGAPTKGGAANMLGRWVANEGHCAGALKDDGAAACENGSTIALSTGDNANGQAISSFFKGESTAEVMKYMGYAAAALGNRELDWSRDQFSKNTKSGGFPYLAANLVASNDEGKALGLKPYRVLTREGVKVGVIGLSSHKATTTPMSGRMAGIEFKREAQGLADTLPAVRADGAQVVVVVSDGCLEDLAPLFEGHDAWQVAFVAGRKCEQAFPEAVGVTRMVYPGRHFNEYVSARVTLDVNKPSQAQLLKVESKTVEVVNDGTTAPEAKAAELIAGYKTKLDAALGETIGFSKTGFEQESAQMSAWLTTSLKEQFKTDVALLNRKGVRQALPPGPITKATIYDLVPFENHVVIVKLTGQQLLATIGNVQARVAGVKPKGEGAVDSNGAAIDLKKIYTVATIDYLYLGGDGFILNLADVAPTMTSTSWQSALIEWTKAQKSDAKVPLESRIKIK